jgi:hypothetical protein
MPKCVTFSVPIVLLTQPPPRRHRFSSDLRKKAPVGETARFGRYSISGSLVLPIAIGTPWSFLVIDGTDREKY